MEAGGIIKESVYRRFLPNLLDAYRVARGPATAFDPSVPINIDPSILDLIGEGIRRGDLAMLNAEEYAFTLEGWLQADDWKVTGTDDESKVTE